MEGEAQQQENDDEFLFARKLLKWNLPDAALVQFKKISPDYELVHLSSIDSSEYFEGIPYVTKLNNVSIIGDRWFVLDENRLLYKETSCLTPFDSILTNWNVTRDKKHAVIAKRNIDRTIEYPCLLLGGDQNYFHWLLRYLSRLALIESLPSLNVLPMLINKDLTRYQQDSLEMLGIQEDQLIKIAPEELVKCRELYIPTSPRVYMEPFKSGCHWLQCKFAKYFSAKNKKGKLLYVSREDAPRRYIRNESEVWNLMQNYGFEKVLPGTLSFKEQIETFSQAAIVVGAHGAGLTNIVFSPPKTKVLELTDTLTLKYNDYELISEAVSLDYSSLVSKKVFVYPKTAFPSNCHDFTVEINQLEALISNFV